MLQHADVAFFAGLIDMDQRITAMTMQLQVSQRIAHGARSFSFPQMAVLEHSACLWAPQRPHVWQTHITCAEQGNGVCQKSSTPTEVVMGA